MRDFLLLLALYRESLTIWSWLILVLVLVLRPIRLRKQPQSLFAHLCTLGASTEPCIINYLHYNSNDSLNYPCSQLLSPLLKSVCVSLSSWGLDSHGKPYQKKDTFSKKCLLIWLLFPQSKGLNQFTQEGSNLCRGGSKWCKRTERSLYHKRKFSLNPEWRFSGLDLFAAICVRLGVCCRAGTEHNLETQRKVGDVLGHVEQSEELEWGMGGWESITWEFSSRIYLIG